MGADTIYQQLRGHLAYLKLAATADALAPALEAAEREKPGYTQFLHDLLATEVAACEQRRLDGRMRFSKLPAHKTLEQFDFTAQPTLDRRLVEDLATLWSSTSSAPTHQDPQLSRLCGYADFGWLGWCFGCWFGVPVVGRSG
jgi:DNA replication protein DnaC